MYALAIIRYRRPVEEVLLHHAEHRAYLQQSRLTACSSPRDRSIRGSAAPCSCACLTTPRTKRSIESATTIRTRRPALASTN